MTVLTARGAGVRRRRRWLFRDLDVTVEAGELVAVVGPPGSGRTTVLLALARRFRLSAGQVDLTGTAALGHVPEVEGPEPVFTVTEHVRERLALLGRSRAEAAGVPLHGLEPELKGMDLSPFQKQVLGLVLAGLSRPAVIALDGLDDGLDATEQAELWRLLDELSAAGTAVLLTARDVDPSRVGTVIRLGADRSAVTTVDTAEAELPVEHADAGRGGAVETEADGGDEGDGASGVDAHTTVAEDESARPFAVRDGDGAAEQEAGGASEAAVEAPKEQR